MKNFKPVAIAFLTILMLNIAFLPCYSQTNPNVKNYNPGDFTASFNSHYNFKILLGCMVYAESMSKKIEISNKDYFLDLSARFSQAYQSNEDIGKVINTYVNNNHKVDLRSAWAMGRISWFIQNYDIIYGAVFGELTSDDKFEEMAKVKNKLFNVPALKAIYQSYMAGRPDMSSLSSNEGNALYIQIAVYLSRQSVTNRNAILKQLL